MQHEIFCVLYDVITKTEIPVYQGQIRPTAEKLGIEGGYLHRLKKGMKTSAKERYILASNKHLLFTLVDAENKIEYECVTPLTLSLYFNQSYDVKIGKYIYALKKGKQKFATIYGKIFCLKGNENIFIRTTVLNKDNSLVKKHKDKTNFKYKISSNLRCRVRQVLSNQCATKNNTTLTLIGCDIEFLKKHLESQFQEGMSWENYGFWKVGEPMKWHIDHIIPCAKFDLTNPEEQKKCFHYSNLQPLWAIDNLAKGGK
jgi:hypothetical protein